MHTSLGLTSIDCQTNSSLTDNTSLRETQSVSQGNHTISHAKTSNKLIVTADQLQSLTGTYQAKQIKTIPCQIAKYGNQFPEQAKPPGNFHGIDNSNDKLLEKLLNSATVSRSVFNPEGSPEKPVKEGHSSDGFHYLWNKQKEKNENFNSTLADPNRYKFNGKQLCVYFSIPGNTDQPTAELALKLIPSDYFSQNIVKNERQISPDKKNDISTVRSAYNCGAINVVVTTDSKIVFGHRDEKSMFPAGFIFGDQTQQTDESIAPFLNDIGKSTTFANLARDTALNERKEEVYDDNSEWTTEVETVGAIGEVLCWPSKKEKQNYQKPVFVVKSTVFMERIPVPSQELTTLRQKKAAKDGHELGELHFLSKDDLKDTDKAKNFIAEHAKCFEMLSQFFTEK